MLRQLSEQVREYLNRAEACASKAEHASSEELRDNYLTLQRRWLSLASSFELGERLVDFSQTNNHRREQFFGDAKVLS